MSATPHPPNPDPSPSAHPPRERFRIAALHSADGGIVSRLAPTPSGYLHPGNAFSFVLTWLLVRAHQGRLLLRIDDLDTGRARPEYLVDLFQTLEWLGLDWELGPQTPDEFTARFSQQHRLELYAHGLRLLARTGRVFACDCSRKQVASLSVDGQYAGRCLLRGISLHSPEVAWRLSTPRPMSRSDQADAQPTPLELAHTSRGELIADLVRPPRRVCLHTHMRDFVIRRRDGIPAYQLASVVDDLYFGVNLVVRGEDLYPSTAAQLYLARCLDDAMQLPAASEESVLFGPDAAEAVASLRPHDFQRVQLVHHPLLRDESSRKLSKSAGAASIRSIRSGGAGPELLLGWVGRNLGVSVEKRLSLAELRDAFESLNHQCFWSEQASLFPLSDSDEHGPEV